jgi:hypothetical protein
MIEHRYILEPYKGLKTRYTCPDCNKPRKFARYIDTETNEHLGDDVGKCERADQCGRHYTPKQHFADTGTVPEQNNVAALQKRREPEQPTSFIDRNIMEQSLSDLSRNNFVLFLHTLFDASTVAELAGKYKIGTSKKWPGSTVFWQIDSVGMVRSGKVMQYDRSTGKRVKKPYDMVTWVHSILKQENFNLKQCFFGQHLLKESTKPVAIVESEKTAIIASIYLPQFTWLASSNKQGLSDQKCRCLKNRKVILYPDLNAFELWQEKANCFGFSISSLLEDKATPQEKENGLDLADYLIQFDVKEFKVSNTKSTEKRIEISDALNKGFSNIIQDKGEKQLSTITTRANNPTTSQVPIDVISLQKFYTDLENDCLIPDEHRSYIGSLWQGVMIYLKDDAQLRFYTDQLEKLKVQLSNTKQTA